MYCSRCNKTLITFIAWWRRKKFVNNFVFPTWACDAGFNNHCCCTSNVNYYNIGSTVMDNVLLLWEYITMFCCCRNTSQCSVVVGIHHNVLLWWEYITMFCCGGNTSQCSVVVGIHHNVLLWWEYITMMHISMKLSQLSSSISPHQHHQLHHITIKASPRSRHHDHHHHHHHRHQHYNITTTSLSSSPHHYPINSHTLGPPEQCQGPPKTLNNAQRSQAAPNYARTYAHTTHARTHAPQNSVDR